MHAVVCHDHNSAVRVTDTSMLETRLKAQRHLVSFVVSACFHFRCSEYLVVRSLLIKLRNDGSCGLGGHRHSHH